MEGCKLMSKLTPYAAFPGVKDALSLLTLLSDKEKLRGIQAVIEELEQARNKYNDIVSDYVVSGDIRKELGKAKAAKEKANALLDANMRDIGEKRQLFDRYQKDKNQGISKRNKELGERERKLARDVDSANKQIEKCEKEISEANEDLVARLEKCAQREVEIEEKEAYYLKIESVIKGGGDAIEKG